MDNIRLRTWLAALAMVLAAVFIAPNFVDTSRFSWWPSKKLNFGLDIQGGLHLVMGVDIDGVVNTTVVRQTKVLESEFAKDGVVVKGFNTDNAKTGQFDVLLNSADQGVKIEALIAKNHASSLQVISTTADKVELKYFDAYMLDQKQNTIRQAIETIRNRIDEFGVAEPSIAQQGDSRILVQLPGMADAEKSEAIN